MSLLLTALLTLVALAQASGESTCGGDGKTCYYVNDPCPAGTQDCSNEYSCQLDTNKCCCTSACPQDWTEHGSFCYNVMSTTGRMTETAARQECQKLGADLPILKSAEENSYLLGMMKEYGETWLGMEAKGSNDFKWVDGTSVAGTFSAWYPGEPNNPGDENCAYMYVDEKRKGRWNNNPCDAKHIVVCQKKVIGLSIPF